MSLKTSANGHTQLLSILDKDMPDEIRRALLAELVMSDDSDHHETITKLFESARRGQIEALTDEKLKELQGMVEELKRGPLRPATFVERMDAGGDKSVRVEVRMSSGEICYPIIVDEKLTAGLLCGDGVLVDAQARVLLYRDRTRVETGEVARFERQLDRSQVLVTLRDYEPQVLHASHRLMARIVAKEVEAGRQLLICTRRQMALDALAEEGQSYYRYQSRDPLPEIRIDQLGDPPAYIFDVLHHVERELKTPELGRKYHLRRAMTKMLAGVSGSGKTVSIDAAIRGIAELASSHTGVPVDQLPNRVMRLRSADVLSKFFGESDQRIARFFDEVLKMSEEKFLAPDGQEYELPVIVVIEECDSIGRERGGSNEQVNDRIQATLLERLDANSRRFGSRLIVVLATTNVPHLVDPAFLRRCGGTVETFGRLRRKSFAAVLEKHLAGKPIAAQYGADPQRRERRLLRSATDWLYDTSGHDRGQVELTYAGSAQSVVWYRREFVTAGLVDRAVQEAAAAACKAEGQGQSEGITRELLLAALDRQIRSIVDQLSPHNVQNYLTLPDGVRVVQVRRIEQPKLSLYELERESA